MREVTALIAALIACAACAGSSSLPVAATSDWPMFRGDLARDGHPAGATLTTSEARRLKLYWDRGLDAAVYGSPVVVGGKVIALSARGEIAAWELKSGIPLWSNRGLGEFSASPAVAGNLVIAGTLTGRVFAFDLASGSEVWSWSAPGAQPALWSSPAVVGQIVLIGIASQYGDIPLEAGRLVALDLPSGHLRWVMCIEAGCAAGGGVWSSVAADGSGHGFVGLGNPDDAVMAFDVATGQKVWETSLYPDEGRDLDVGATPVVIRAGEREEVAVGSNGGVFALLDANHGSVIWSRSLVEGAPVHGLIASPAYDGTSVYVGSASAPTDMFALDPQSGATVWTRSLELPDYSAPVVGEGVLVFGIGDTGGANKGGRVMALSTADGSVIWSYATQDPVLGSPALAGKTVVVGTTRGILYAFAPA